MKNLIIIFIINISLVSCTSKQDSSIILFNNISFKLNAGEKVVKIDSNKKEIFNSYFDTNSIEMPLFRCIKSDNYLIFLAIPFNTSLKELTDHSLTHTLNQTFFEGDSTNYFYKKYINENEKVAIYTKNFSNNLIYVLTVSNSAELIDSLFSQNELSNRFKK